MRSFVAKGAPQDDGQNRWVARWTPGHVKSKPAPFAEKKDAKSAAPGKTKAGAGVAMKPISRILRKLGIFGRSDGCNPTSSLCTGTVFRNHNR